MEMKVIDLKHFIGKLEKLMLAQAIEKKNLKLKEEAK